MVHLDTFETLADPTRRRIVEALSHGERVVGDIVERAGIHQSGVSRHLRILHEAGFVLMRPDGQRRFYALKPEPFRELDGWLAKYRRLWEARLDRFGTALETQRKKRQGRAAAAPHQSRRSGGPASPRGRSAWAFFPFPSRVQ
jgi:DNA-binding transcriptional ArsR family regulator